MPTSRSRLLRHFISPGITYSPCATSLLSSSHMHAMSLIRGFCSLPPSPSSVNQEKESPGSSCSEKAAPLSTDCHYLGPLASSHKILKRVSLGNTLIACAAAPYIMASAESISYVSRVGLSSSLVFFGLLTTAALHWITVPYVHELKFTAESKMIDVRTTTLFGLSRWRSFHLDEVKPLPWNRPVATFMARDRFYYIDIYSFPDEDLLKKLSPDDVPAGYKDDPDED